MREAHLERGTLNFLRGEIHAASAIEFCVRKE